MKKVLIITYSPDHTFGGTEIYAEKLIKIFKELKWDVTEYSLDVRDSFAKMTKPDHKVVCPKLPVNESCGLINLSRLKKAKKELNDLKKKYKFNLIINNLGDGFKWEYIPKNEILIQHFCIDYYRKITLFKNNFFASIGRFLTYIFTGFVDIMQYHDNVVFFTNKDQEEANKVYGKKFNSYNINLTTLNYKEINAINKQARQQKLVYVGRIENSQKNMKYFSKVAKYLKYPVDVYGRGKYTRQIAIKKNINYCGVLKREKLFSTISNYTATLLLSKYEGFPYAAIESLTAGTPLISSDTYCSAKLLTKEKGLLVDIKQSPKKCAEQINDFLKKTDIETMSKKCTNFALKNLTNKIFENKWKEIIKNY